MQHDVDRRRDVFLTLPTGSGKSLCYAVGLAVCFRRIDLSEEIGCHGGEYISMPRVDILFIKVVASYIPIAHITIHLVRL